MIKLTDDLLNLNTSKFSKVRLIAKKLRKKLEEQNNWTGNKAVFSGKCYDISKELVEQLNKNGIYAYRQLGEYRGADVSYKPDTDTWAKWEKEEYEQYLNIINCINPGYAHWWVVADNEWIIDITADQFHPDNPDEYRVVISTVENDTYGA